MRKRKISFIVNPISGTHNKDIVIDLINQAIRSSSDNVDIYYTKCAGDATVHTEYLVKNKWDMVVAVGGDGTVNEVARGLLGTSTSLGVVPLGSGNGLARHLKIPLNPIKAIDLVLKGTPTTIDCGTLNDRPFFCTAGIGFDAQVGRKFSLAKRRGFLSYAQASVQEYISFDAQTYRISLDGTTFSRRAFLITFANASQWGFNARIAPLASINDGKLDMVIMSPFHPLKAPLIGMRMFTQSIHHSKNVEVFRFKEIEIERERAGYIHIDGDPLREGRILKIKNIHNALKVVAGTVKI